MVAADGISDNHTRPTQSVTKAANIDEAIALLRKARDVAQSVGEPAEEVAAMIDLADTHRQAGETDLAIELLQKAATLAANIGDDDALARARDALAAAQADAAAQPAATPQPQADHPTPAPQQPDWDNLRLVDEGGSAPPQQAPPEVRQSHDDLVARLIRERDEARQRVAELEAELEEYKRIVESLRAIVGQAMRNT